MIKQGVGATKKRANNIVQCRYDNNNITTITTTKQKQAHL